MKAMAMLPSPTGGHDALDRRQPHVTAREDARNARFQEIWVSIERPAPLRTAFELYGSATYCDRKFRADCVSRRYTTFVDRQTESPVIVMAAMIWVVPRK